MRLLLIATFTLGTIGTVHASSESKLKSCITKVYGTAAQMTAESKEIVSFVSENVRECRASVADDKKREAAAKKAANNAKRIKRLQDQLAKLQK